MGSCVSACLLSTGIVIGMIHNKIGRRRTAFGSKVIVISTEGDDDEDMAVDLDHSTSSSDELKENT